jgi:octaprenyl-diphosphate synthase
MQTGSPSSVPSSSLSSSVQARKTRPTGIAAGIDTRVSPVLRSIQLVADEMQQAEVELQKLLSSDVAVIEEISHYLASAGGKRLRPLITALGARAVGLEGPLARLMCVGELLHLGSLLHDDVVDEGIERRGRTATQRVYGNPATILAGDVCLARSIALAAEEAGPDAVMKLSQAMVGMAEGEVLQLMNVGDLSLDLDTYMDIIQRKSARLIAWCASAGAWSRGETEMGEALARFGTQVGIAFQITDDVLDYIGEKRLTGKRRGQDLAEGKLTLPLVLAMESTPEIRDRLSRGAPSPERIPALIEEVCQTGAPEQALEMARSHVDIGLKALNELPSSPWRDSLTEIAHYLVDRVS